MSSFRTIAKEGWHPKSKDGGKESWRSDFKGIDQVAGWMGKGRDSNSERSERTAAPLSSLKNPASFGPPPKHSGYHGTPAPPRESTRDRSGLGAPVSEEPGYQQDTRQYPQQEYQQQRQVEVEVQEPEEEEKPPPTPFRVNTTGLKTDHLPPPPRCDSDK